MSNVEWILLGTSMVAILWAGIASIRVTQLKDYAEKAIHEEVKRESEWRQMADGRAMDRIRDAEAKIDGLSAFLGVMWVENHTAEYVRKGGPERG